MPVFEEFSFPSSTGENTIRCLKCLPDGAPRGVVQIEHGIAEHMDRYRDFMSFLAENGYLIENIDSTVIAQAPRLRPYIDEMRANIARALDLDVTQVSVKATTEEHLGFTGRGEGISAQAVALITSPRDLTASRVDLMEAADIGGCSSCPMRRAGEDSPAD